MRSVRATAGIAALSLMLVGCSIVPGAGPFTGDVERGAGTPYVLVDLDQNTAKTVNTFVTARRADPPIVLPPGRPLGLIGPGDTLQVSIWEPNPAGTSLTADKSGLATMTRVGTDGTIGIPYVGRLRAAGRTPAQIEREIVARMTSTTPGVQAAVLATEDMTNVVIVQGDVTKPGRYPVVPSSSGLLDILAMAGGSQTANRQALVRITRDGTSVTRTLTNVVHERALETDLAPGDRILVLPRLAHFYAFGAVLHPGEQYYDADEISLARMLARTAGLDDNRANPAAVFVYRHQPAELTRQITSVAPTSGGTQVIYRLNLRDPNGFFVSQKFPILPDDLVYVSDSAITETAKVFQIITGLSNTAMIPHNFGAPY